MGYITKLAVILTIVTAIAAGSLALVNMKTKPIIDEYIRIQEENARTEVMPEGKQFVLKGADSDTSYYEVYGGENGDELIGYVFTALGKGYSSTIKTVTGIDLDYNLLGIKITFQQETPGLGAKCEEISYGESDPWFQRQFFKKYYEQRGEPPLNALTIACDKDGGRIHSITGATITGRAISNSIKQFTSTIKSKVEG